jgi:glycosyltransferase involved in cell wall biosynthesis
MMRLSRSASGVTAVVLTTGEATTEQAMESLRAQSLSVDETIVVRDVRPFHQALNAGARQVTTPYFIQVDSDMVLDRQCVATLRRAMKADVGIAVGLLRDAMVQQVVGIKLFRTECFSNHGFRNSISPDTDFADQIERAGWRTVYVGRRPLSRSDPWRTIGEHRPDYSPVYTYRKYLMEGERYRYRNATGGFRGRLESLEQSTHPSAIYARVGLARGFFRRAGVDALGRQFGDDEFARLHAFLEAQSTAPADDAPSLLPTEAPIRERFVDYFRFGQKAFLRGDVTAFRDCLQALRTSGETADNWLFQLALCQGLLATCLGEEEVAYTSCEEFLPASDASDHAFTEDVAQADQAFEDVAGYAATTGLRQFVLAAPNAAEYLSPQPFAPYSKTTATVKVREDGRGRQRIEVPFRLLGHVVSSEPERIGLMWSFDLLKSGYTFVHLAGAFGAYQLFLPALVVRKALERVGWRWAPTKPNQESTAFALMAGIRTPSYAPVVNCVLMVSENLVRGGSERQMLAAAKGLLDRGFAVKLLALERLENGVPSYESDFVTLGVVVEYSSANRPPKYPLMQTKLKGIPAAGAAQLPGWLSWRMVEVAEAVARHRPVVIHAWLDGPGVACALAGCTMGVPRTVIQQGSLAISRRGHSQSDVIRRAYAAVARNASVTIINNSEAGARDNERWIGLPSGSIGVLLNGFVPGSSVPAAPSAVKQFRAMHGLPPDALVVGTVMRFVPEKDPELWLNTAASIAKVRPAIRFLICGFGLLEPNIIAKITQLGLKDCIVLAGPVTDAGLAYSAMDVVLLTSTIEGLPNVMIEAQAVGRPVVSTDAGGTGEAVSEGVTGTIVRARSADQLAAAVIATLDNPGWRASVVTEGPKFVDARFGLDRMVDETIRYYGEVIKPSSDALL